MISAKAVSKRFGAVQALDCLDFEVLPGEIHGLVGENGAGKSTLMKILAGVYPADSGALQIKGRTVEFSSPQSAYRHGVRIVHQELSLIPSLSVAENLHLHEMADGGLRRVRRSQINQRAARLLHDWGLEVDPSLPVEELSTGRRQLVEIVRELAREGSLLILDEPTTSLSSSEVDHLFEVLSRLRSRGISTIFISHRLSEVLRVSDRLTVLRNGRQVATRRSAEFPLQEVVSCMLGRELAEHSPAPEWLPSQTLLSIRDLSGPVLKNVSFQVRRSEILGVAGLLGSGRSELLRSLFGLHPVWSGRVELDGQPLRAGGPAAALRAGLALLPENRQDEGLFPSLAVASNLVLMQLDQVSRRGWLSRSRIRRMAAEIVTRLSIRTADPYRQQVRHLSGGNQQKVVLGRILSAHPALLLLDEPTRGVDVGTRREIHRLVMDYVRPGRAALVVSSDIAELVQLCHRILVLHRGGLAGSFDRDEFDQGAIVRCTMGQAA